MAIQAQNEKLNIVPGGIIPVVHASQYDVDRVLTFTLYDGLSAASLPSGVTGLIEGTKPDNKGFQYAVTSISGNVVTVVTTKQMTAVQGTVKCKIVLLKDNMVLGTALFFLEVDEAGLADDTDISATELPFIRDMAETNMLNAEAWARGTRNNVPVASTDETYHNNSKYYSEQSSSSATAAAESATAAANSATAAASSATAAAGSATAAANSESNAADSEASAEESEANAAISAADAKAYADLFFGFLRPKGQITFAELPSAAEALAGDWYVISDAFVTTSDFVVGAGVSIPAGSNVYMTVNEKWGIIQGSIVGGVKGAAESTYRSGLVNLSYSNLGTAPIANGGTGLTSSPSMLTNLGSTSADNILKASPRPGVTGTLAAGNGGTGYTSLQATRNAMGLGNTTGALPVANGGTGQTSLQATRNAMGLGNTTGALPVANGGTGATTAANARSNLGLGTAATYGIGSVASGNTGLVTGAAVFNAVRVKYAHAWDYNPTLYFDFPPHVIRIRCGLWEIGTFTCYFPDGAFQILTQEEKNRGCSFSTPSNPELTKKTLYSINTSTYQNTYVYMDIKYQIDGSGGTHSWTGYIEYHLTFNCVDNYVFLRKTTNNASSVDTNKINWYVEYCG